MPLWLVGCGYLKYSVNNKDFLSLAERVLQSISDVCNWLLVIFWGGKEKLVIIFELILHKTQKINIKNESYKAYSREILTLKTVQQ